MKKALKGIRRSAIQLDFDLYRRCVPIQGISDCDLSVIDIWPEGVEKTLVFVHGYAGCAETWEHQINQFSRDYRVLAPDLRGHGQSDAPFSQYTMEEMVEDIDTISAQLDLPEQFVLVGHSFGGAICVEYANAFPKRLEKLILIATAGEYPLPKIVSLVSRIPTAAFRPWWKYRPRWNAEVHVMKRMMLNNMLKWKGWPLLENIRIPTLIITGERDRYFPSRVFEGLAKSIPGAQVVDIGASKHKVQLERHKAVNRAIERFIQDDQQGRRMTWRDQALRGESLDKPWLLSYGKHTPHTFPIPRQPLHKFLEATADMFPNRIATVFYGATLTYHQLERKINQFAHALHGMGVGPGDRVMLVLPNMPQMIIAYYAILKIGGIAVLSNPDADAAMIAHQIKETGAKMLVTLSAFAGMAQTVQEHSDVKMVFAEISNAVSKRTYARLIDRWETAGFSPQAVTQDVHGYNMDRLMMDASRESPHVDVSPQDIAAILYTSGTTGEPKGVCLTHANLVANALQTRHWIPNLGTGSEIFLSVIPLTHSYGMTSAMNIPLAMGATLILLSVFELDQVLSHIKRYKPTIFPGVPSIYMAINQAPDVRSYGLSSIKACISGAAPLPIEVQEQFEKLSHANLVEGYGLTEASPVTHANPFDAKDKVGTIGIPIPNTDAKIVDLITGDDLPPGKIGELVIRGPQIMKGYWSEGGIDEKETLNVLRDGWLFTGDVAVMDSDGFFSIISRKRDTIMAGEFSVYPRDVEEVLYENSKVLEAAVVGIEAGEEGQRVKAFIVPRPGTSLSKDELLDLCRQRLEAYAVPWEIEFRAELPKSFVGKVLGRMLVEKGD